MEHCVVVAKDSDFVESFLLRHEPWKLLLVSTGNIGNNELLRLFQLNIEQLAESFKTFDFIELNRTSIATYDRFSLDGLIAISSSSQTQPVRKPTLEMVQ